MSTPEEKLTARLLAINAVTAIVGTRIYPEKLPQTVSRSSIVYRRVMTRRTNSAGGATKTGRAMLQLELECSSYTEAKSLAAAVRGDPEAGGGPSGLSGWVDSDGCIWHLVNERDEPGAIRPGQDEFEDWGITMDFVVWYSD